MNTLRNACPRNIQYRLWERSEGRMGIPDMTAIVYEFAFSYVADKAKYDTSKILTDLAYMAYSAGSVTSPSFATSPSQLPSKSPAAK